MRDLAVLVADGTTEAVFRAFFERERWHDSIGCTEIEFVPSEDVFHNPLHKDGGVYASAHEILRPYTRTHRHALVVLDQQFGAERPAAEITAEILANLKVNGWNDSCAVVVIDPEIEVWLWQDNPHVAAAVEFDGPSLRKYLEEAGEWPAGQAKPTEPKETFERVCRPYRHLKPKVVYARIARKVSLRGCTDPAFLHMQAALRTWFPTEAK